MLGHRAKAGVLVAALLVLAVEGVLLIRYYDRYHGSDVASGTTSGTASDTPSSSAPAFEATMPEGTMPEGTIREKTTAALDDAAIKATDDAEAPDPDKTGDKEVSFAHRATDENSRGDYTYLSNPAIDGDPDAVVLVAVDTARGATGEQPTATK